MKDGLVPQVGARSKQLNESQGVFLFQNIEDMNTALGQWLGDWFNDLEDEIGSLITLMSLQITLPNNFPIEDSIVEYEKICRVTIPPELIKYLKDE